MNSRRLRPKMSCMIQASDEIVRLKFRPLFRLVRNSELCGPLNIRTATRLRLVSTLQPDMDN
eukprot:2306892-Rhodomonas_salina.1